MHLPAREPPAQPVFCFPFPLAATGPPPGTHRPAHLQVLPRLGQLLHQWSPLDQPGLAAAEFAAWRPLLESEAARQGAVFGGSSAADLHSGADAYMRLVAELVLPPLRKDLTNSWDPRWVQVGGWRHLRCQPPLLSASGLRGCGAAVLFAFARGAALPRCHGPCPPAALLPRWPAGTLPGWSALSRPGSRCCPPRRCSTSWSHLYCLACAWRYRPGTRCATQWPSTPGCTPGW